MNKKKIAVIGGGAGGMMVAGKLASFGFDTTIFDKNEKLGKKLFITGKGRCNLANFCSENDFLDNVVINSKFLYSAIYAYTPQNIVELFNTLGLETKVERGNRVFPVSDKSSDVIQVLKNFCIRNDVKVNLNEEILSIEKQGEIFNIISSKREYQYDIVIIATGGKSYKATGSDGSGYEFARKLGHSIIDVRPALVPIKLGDKFITFVEGVSLKNVTLFAKYKGRIIKSLFGEMLFTNNGISGPIALSLSSYINKLSIKDIEIYIDFKPALSTDKLLSRIERDVISFQNKQVSSLIQGLLPKNLVTHFLDCCGIEKEIKCKSLNKKDLENIVSSLKNFKLNYLGLYDINFAIITSGGVSTKEINPKTMESKLVNNLYFVGEIIDVDALTGGYNLQIAWSTANLAADAINERSYE